MADKFIVWEIKVAGSWITVSEPTFNFYMRLTCDVVKFRCGRAVFYNKNGYPTGRVYEKEV